MNGPRIPPCTANIGLACYACFKEELRDGVTLQKCTMCRMVRYCGPACQKKDWSQHKNFCKASHQAEKGEITKSALLFSLADDPLTDLQTVNTIVATIVQNSLQFHQFSSKRTPTVAEQNLYSYEPRCMACARTDRLMRMEASRNKSSSPNTLKACSECKMAFYCSDAHWEAVQHFHAGEPCIDGHDGLSQCQVNQEIRVDIAFANIMAGAEAGSFKWAPERVKSSWTSLNSIIGWEDEYSQELAQFFSIPVTSVGPWIRGASEALSLPMSILWALENLNENDAWTRQDTLLIHILGANELEVLNAQIFEEILHRLPLVKVLKLVLCGPQISEITASESGERDRVIDMETCLNCKRQGRKRLHIHHDKTYHDYAKSMGTTYTKPDLAIAFNSGCSQEAVSSWKETIDFLMQNNIPSIFTAYNHEEAEAEAEVLKSTGVKLKLGPMKNKWGSIMARCEPSKVTGFYSVNGWVAGGFR